MYDNFYPYVTAIIINLDDWAWVPRVVRLFQIYPGEDNRLSGVRAHYLHRVNVFLEQCFQH